MATRRMWLVYRPTGARILLAKYFDEGWKVYTGPTEIEPQKFFDQAEFRSEEFVIEYE